MLTQGRIMYTDEVEDEIDVEVSSAHSLMEELYQLSQDDNYHLMDYSVKELQEVLVKLEKLLSKLRS